jgi:hypothetical protein
VTGAKPLQVQFEVLREERQYGNLAQVVAFGKANNLPYIAYERGQHIQPEKQAELSYNAALGAAQMQPRMADLYRELIRVHRDLGCKMLMHFSSLGNQGMRWGSWGAKARYSDADAQSPKMRALLESNVQRE